jgi:hypothetical protein
VKEDRLAKRPAKKANPDLSIWFAVERSVLNMLHSFRVISKTEKDK